MKGSNSRHSFRGAKRYSNLHHIQGGMITDADLSEAALIHQSRDEAQSTAMVSSGVPQVGGMLDWSEGDVGIKAGTVFAQGKQGYFTHRKSGVLSVAEAFAAQSDLPNLLGEGQSFNGTGFVYADLWDRPVFSAEDTYLTDAGLHGAQTSYRTRTMVQLKLLPDTVPMPREKLAAFMAKHPAFAPKGNATVTLGSAVQTQNTAICDPCADTITIENDPPNALFRLEIISVHNDENGNPSAITLAWSFENGEQITSLETRETLAKKDHIFEYFSATTEMHIGHFSSPMRPVRPIFAPDLSASSPSPQPGFEPSGGIRTGAYTHVRRWNGAAQAAISGGQPAFMGPDAMTRDGDELILSTPYFTLKLNTKGAKFVAGDFWLVEMRRFAADGGQFLLNSGPADHPSEPQGTAHHFCPLFFVKNGKVVPEALDDAARRQLDFPPLADLPADRIGYDAPKDCDLLGATENVQQALDAICDIDARHVGFTDPEDCPPLQGAKTVEQALIRLCKADDNDQLKLLLRHMMDWGVATGAGLGCRENSLRIAPGVVLDRHGVIHQIEAAEFDINKLGPDNLLGGERALAAELKRRGHLCLSVGFRGEKQQYFLSSRARAYVDLPPSLQEVMAACLKGKPGLGTKIFGRLDAAQLAVLSKIHVTLRNVDDAPKQQGFLSEFDRNDVALANKLLAEAVEALAAFHGDEHKAALEQIFKRIEREAATTPNRPGSPLNIAAMRFGAVIKLEEDLRRDCLCDAIDVPADNDKSQWSLVPIGCVEIDTITPGRMTLLDCCMSCCRKQANSWRSHGYYFGDKIAEAMRKVEDICCGQGLSDNEAVGQQLLDWLRARGLDPWIPDEAGKIWPPLPSYADQALKTATSVRETAEFGNEGAPAPRVLDVSNLETETAMAQLKKVGLEISATIEADDRRAMAKLLGANTPVLNQYPERGDKVALLVRGGRAVDYLIIHRKRRIVAPDFPGRPPIGRGPTVIGRDPVIGRGGVTGDIGAIRLRELEEFRALEDRLNLIETAHPEPAIDTEDLIKTMDAKLEAVETRLKATRGAAPISDSDLQAIAFVRSNQAKLARSLETPARPARDPEVTALKKQVAALTGQLRATQPVSAFFTTAQARKLMDGNVTTMGQFEKLTPRRVGKLMGVQPAQGQALKAQGLAKFNQAFPKG